MSHAAIIVAGGRGQRAGGNGPKQYAAIGGKTVIQRTVEVFLSHGGIAAVVVVIHPDDRALCIKALGDLASRVAIVDGGATRQDSTWAGLHYLQDLHPLYVHIHDGARPFLQHTLLNHIYQALTLTGGILPALPVSDTLKRVDNHSRVMGTLPREQLFTAQTPQSFPYSLIYAAHAAAQAADKHDFTDDAAIAEWYNIPMQIVAGCTDNIKITWPRDLAMADRHKGMNDTMFPDIRTGNGYDVHRLVTGDGVTLCGVKIPYHQTLSGHSDADVALHALTDALLATQAAGDIGTHFPPSDPQWQGAASEIFVRHAVRLIREKHGRIANIDITLIAEAPKIGPHRAAMTQALQTMLGIDADRISVKATTNEALGFIGREEGIAALATATVIYAGEVPA